MSKKIYVVVSVARAIEDASKVSVKVSGITTNQDEAKEIAQSEAQQEPIVGGFRCTIETAIIESSLDDES